ncbi:MAG: hypothetical protein L6V87_02360 [Ruminococcus sp.]|nr:MAG: hypothetical protein L6V87_02360 [Ruminococcus sp.]
MPDSLINELLKQDPEAALDYATQLLKDPKKLSKIRSLYKDDEGVSNIIANMVTENSDEFEKLGTDAGTLFGDSFMEAFKANWEQSMKDVFLTAITLTLRRRMYLLPTLRRLFRQIHRLQTHRRLTVRTHLRRSNAHLLHRAALFTRWLIWTASMWLRLLRRKTSGLKLPAEVKA